MSIISTVKFITNHPLNRDSKLKAVFRFVKWQFQSKINNQPLIHNFTEKSKIIIQKGMTGATGNLYCGLHEFNDMGFLLHFLRENDLFVDIGANVGSYTILASAQIGCESISFEPVPSTYQNLKNNISLNKIQEKVTALNIALGGQIGEIYFTSSLDTMNHVSKDKNLNDILVKVSTLDDILKNENTPSLIKIDVEGFETEVLKGASLTLHNEGLKAIIIELNGSGEKLGFDEKVIHKTLLELNFKPYTYDPFKRKLTLAMSYGEENTIYLRDLFFVKKRVEEAKRIKVLNKEF